MTRLRHDPRRHLTVDSGKTQIENPVYFISVIPVIPVIPGLSWSGGVPRSPEAFDRG